MEGCISPDNYINFGFHYLIAAALQRRVWFGPDHMRLYPNIYVVLVGNPGVGKGLVIMPLASLLKYHKLPDPGTLAKQFEKAAQTDTDKQVAQIMADSDVQHAQKEHDRYNGKDKPIFEKPLLFPVAADATTYEALVTAMAKAIRGRTYVKEDPNTGKNIMGTYLHSSLCFCLEEISSLFRRHTEDLVNFLIKCYDCGDYEKDTKTQGKDRVRRPCLNFFGGTTPDFMQSVFSDSLLTQGFSSRTFFVFASKNRKEDFWIPELNSEQRECERNLLEHIEKLSHLYGEIRIGKEARDFLTEWWPNEGQKRSNSSLKLDAYYGRKNIHVRKIAAAIHFANSLEMEISLEEFKCAINLLETEERTMHLGLGLDNKNPLAKPARLVERYLQLSGRKTFKELLAEFWSKLPNPPKDNLEMIVEHLETGRKISRIKDIHPISKAQVIYFYIPKYGIDGTTPRKSTETAQA